MEPWTIALLIRPAFNFLAMVLIVLPIEWVLFQVFPNGRLKVALFKHRTRDDATRRDKVIVTTAVVAGYLVLAALVGALSLPR
jgi:hypothetical protein